MAGLPTPRSYEDILGDMLATYMSKIGVNDLNTGSAVLSFFEAMAQAVYRSSGDTFAILRDFSVDRAEGESLKRLQKEEGVSEIPARVASGQVTITDTSFVKKATKIYAGSNPPNIGSTIIRVSDASEFSASGSIYIGRGTPNIEGPLPYTSITSVGGFFEINLSSPTTKFHNLSESVILAQGGVRTIQAGTTVSTVASGSSPNIVFTVTQKAIILDGEDTVTSVPVSAQEPGTDGNVPRGAIREFVGEPFVGASVVNEIPFTTGKNVETDPEIRVRIKKARISRGLGTATAVKNAVQGIQATDESATITSNEIFTDGEDTRLFIDNGKGYEEKTSGVGLEFIVDSALGGETHFQLATGGSQTSVAKAFLETTVSAPFSISPLDRLAVLVGGILSEHEFKSGDFRSNGFASAFEVASSINSNSALKYTARTTNNGKKVTISAKEESGEFIKITTPTSGNNAATALGFPSSEVQTLRLYKNRQPLNKNGRSAKIESANQSDWSNTITSGDTLKVSVDGTDEITYTFVDADFIAEGTHSTVAKTNTLASWVNVFNTKITGLTASINGNRLVITSNLGAKSRAQIVISDSSSFVSKGIFPTANGLTSQGDEADFKLSRNTAQIKLTDSLEAGDSLTAGTEFTKGAVSSDLILGGSATLSDTSYFWFVVDNQDAKIINHAVSADSLIHFTKEASNVVRFRAEVLDAFVNVQEGDYVILWSEELSAGNRIEGRVHAVGTDTFANDFFELRLTATEYASASSESPVIFQEGLSFVRTARPPQKIKVDAGTFNINVIASTMNDAIKGATVAAENDEVLTVTTNTKDTNGSVLLVTFNDPAKSLNFSERAVGNSIVSQFAFYESGNREGDFPLFAHSSVSADRQADPPNSLITDFDSVFNLPANGFDPNNIVCMLQPYLFSGNQINDAQADGECVQIDSLSGTNIDISESQSIRRLRTNDRYYLASPFDFGHEDSIVAILDADASNKIFPIPLYRRAIANSTMPVNANDFRAYDVDSGATIEFEQFFGSSYSFKNYKTLMQARNVIDPSSATNEDAVLFRSAEWGRAGERFKVQYIYPAAANNAIAHIVSVGDDVDIKIALKSGAPVTNTIDGTTEWDVTITPNTPVAGVDEVTYTYNGTGTAPTLGTLVSGNYVTINGNGEFSPNNIGTFRVSSATTTSFTVRRPNGVAVAENNISTLEIGTIALYVNSDTTAQEIADYVNASVTDHLTATVIDDNGSTGAGIISLSTFEDSDFTSESVALVDGVNWISTSVLSNSAPNAQFTFKNPLTLPSFNTNTSEAYAFNNGEEVRIVPTTAQHLDDLISTLAVSGITTLGEVDTSQKLGRLQIGTQVLGSTGAIEISGGVGNKTEATVIGVSTDVIGTDYIKSTITRSAGAGFHADQWVRVAAKNFQKKETGISLTTSATIVANSPTAGKSTIELGNKEVGDRYFGQPRNHFRERGRAFHVEKHGTLVCISHDGLTGASPVFSKTVEINADGGDIEVDFNGDTSLTEYIITSGTRNFSEVQIGDLFTISGFAEAENNGSFRVSGVSDDGLSVSVLNFQGVDEGPLAIGAGNLAITTAIEEGDTVEIGAPFSVLNQGQFRVIRTFNDSLYIENNSAIEERVLIVDNLISLGYDGATEFDVSIEDDVRISWNTNGTQPTIENAKQGDLVTIGTDFAAANQGEFMVTKSRSGLKETFNVTLPPASSITTGQSFHFDFPNAGTSYYVWFDKDAGGGDPAPGGRTAIPVSIVSADNDQSVASKVQIAIDAVLGVTATALDEVVKVVLDDFGDAIDAVNIDVGGVFAISKTQDGRLPFIELANALGVAESGITVSDILEVHRPTMKFHPYENTVVGDKFVISGDVLTAANIGTFNIVEVIDRNKIVVNKAMSPQDSVVFSNKAPQVYVEEGSLYYGYKKIFGKAVDSSNTNRYRLVFDSYQQKSKINQAANVNFSAMSKLGFSQIVKSGLDSYRFHTGLIAQANKKVYGDPRDSITFPGVAAAGAEIFIEPPLVRRIEISINVRVNTGIPFSRIAEQVRNNIAALVNSSPIGEAIAISDIISSVNKIPGVKAISISSPAYSPTSDVILVNPAEKPFILDIVNDITVSKVD